jgi:hypothetical protein
MGGDTLMAEQTGGDAGEQLARLLTMQQMAALLLVDGRRTEGLSLVDALSTVDLKTLHGGLERAHRLVAVCLANRLLATSYERERHE